MHKHPISLTKLRTVPRQFSWVDHRLVRERYIDQLSPQACALYLFLVTVADAQGLSYYADSSLCQRLSLTSQVRASRQFRITLDTNPYSVPAHYAGQALTLKTYPDRLCIYHGDQLIARHLRRYERFQDVEDPDHPKPLLEQRKKARDHQLFRRFLALSPRAEAYYLQLEARRLNPQHHLRKIVALSDIYTPEAVAHAMEDALTYEAFSAEYIANLLEQRARCTPEASALHLTRRADLLELTLAPPDLSLYHATPPPTPDET
jgi:hypothetical protein